MPLYLGINNKKRIKLKKTKRPFISEEEWKEFDEEDDEMMFIETAEEDD